MAGQPAVARTDPSAIGGAGCGRKVELITAEIEFADARGAVVRLQPYGPAGTKTIRRENVEVRTGPSGPTVQAEGDQAADH